MIVPLCAAVLSGCEPAAPKVFELMNREHCEGAHTGVTRVTYADIAALRGGRLIPQPDASDAQDVLFSVSNGEQRSGGYALTFLSASMPSPGHLQVKLAWQAPAADAATTTVMTHPCLVLGLSDTTVRTVQVDLNDKPFGSLDVKGSS